MYPAKVSFKIEGEIKKLSMKTKQNKNRKPSMTNKS
jgi:hypothetical protein